MVSRVRNGLGLYPSEVTDLAASLRNLFHRFNYPVPEFIKGDNELIRAAALCIGTMLWAVDNGLAAKSEKQVPSHTAGMNLAQRVAHVGGRTNQQGYIEFGSPMALDALIQHVLRDLQYSPPKPRPSEQPSASKLDADLLATLREAAKTKAEGAITKDGRFLFINYGEAEQQMLDHAAQACPHCGGSGHKGDVQPTSEGDQA